MAKFRVCQLMYYMYIRVVILGALFRHSSIYRTFTKRVALENFFTSLTMSAIPL